MDVAIVGLGHRHYLFLEAVTGNDHPDYRLIGLCDSNPARLAQSQSRAETRLRRSVPAFAAADYERMLETLRPHIVVVTTPDFTHHHMIVAAMERGCAVISEKPLTTDAGKLRAILEAKQRSGQSLRVAFNYRYAPARTQLKRLLHEGIVGRVTAIDFRWRLDRVHGADYFRRWHRQRALSGGLLVHKATHHFDLLNWWTGSRPTAVSAFGSRQFYTPQTAAVLGLAGHGERCQACDHAGRCDYRLDLAAHPPLSRLYLEAEAHDQYFRDRCVFAACIDIEDTVQASIRYANGATATYTLIAYSPFEGLDVTFHGTEGEMRYQHVESHGVAGGAHANLPTEESQALVFHPHDGPPREIAVEEGAGSHGGGDTLMLNDLFSVGPEEPDPFLRRADHIDGTYAVLTGICASASILSGETINIDSFVREHRLPLEALPQA